MVDQNTSATGGVLPPAPPPAPTPLEGLELLDFIQTWLTALSGLPGRKVRPAFQTEPPNIPSEGDAWAAFRIGDRPSDTFPYVKHQGANGGSSTMQRNEELNLLVSFYDLGATGLADKYAALVRDGALIPQNLEMLAAGDLVLGYTGVLQPVPVMVKSRWLYRVDLPIVLRRQVTRVYQVRNVETAGITLYTDNTPVLGPFPIEVADSDHQGDNT